MFAFIHIFGVLFALLCIPLILVSFVFWIWMLIHAISNRGLSDGEKVAWVLVILFLHFLGALIYFFVARSRSTAVSF
jgi:hypothetical protein